MSSLKQIRLPAQQLEGGLLEPAHGEPIPDEPIAVLALEPPDLESRLGIAFQQSFDNLDYVDIALLERDSGQRFALIRHQGAHNPGTEIHVPHSQATARTLDEIVLDLALAGAQVAGGYWAEDDVKARTVQLVDDAKGVFAYAEAAKCPLRVVFDF